MKSAEVMDELCSIITKGVGIMGYTNAQGTYIEHLTDGRTLAVDPGNYQAMYQARVWDMRENGLPNMGSIVIGGCENMEEVIEEARAWAEGITRA